MSEKREIRFRVYLAFTGVCLLGIAIVVKAALIQTKEGAQLRKEARETRIRPFELKAERGNVYTEDGKLLCSTIPQFDLRVDYSVIPKDTFNRYVRQLSEQLADLFKDASARQYEQRLIDSCRKGKRYDLLKRNVSYLQYQQVRTFAIFNKGQARGGLIVKPKIKRINPYGMLAYRTIGLCREFDDSNKQRVVQNIGLERAYDSVLRGKHGMRMEQRLTGGVWMPIEGTEVDPQNGHDIVTTIDIGIQEVAEHAMLSVLTQYECEYGTAVVMEVHTGKIRAMVNLGRQSNGTYYEIFNYAMIPTEPGSTFKMATLTALMRDKLINIEQPVNCNGGAKQFFDRTMHDSHHGLGVMPIKNAFAQSSNVAMATLAQQHYGDNPKKYIAHLKALHLNTRTGIDLIGENKPFMIEPGESDWRKTTLPWMATGYGIQVTPLHTCMLYNAIANNGRMMKPYLVSAVREYGMNVRIFQPTVLVEQIAPPEGIAQLRKCAEEVVLTGTGKHIQSAFYPIAGKTGTAQVVDVRRGIGYKDGAYQSSFVGYFPADNPKYTMIVVIRTQPRAGTYYGGALAAPVFKMISDKIFASGQCAWKGPLDSIAQANKSGLVCNLAATGKNYEVLLSKLGIKVGLNLPDRALTQLDTDTAKRLTVKPKAIVRGIVPDVSGMGLKDAVYLLENEGLKVRVVGRGVVHGQSVTPGSRINKGQQITLTLG